MQCFSISLNHRPVWWHAPPPALSSPASRSQQSCENKLRAARSLRERQLRRFVLALANYQVLRRLTFRPSALCPVSHFKLVLLTTLIRITRRPSVYSLGMMSLYFSCYSPAVAYVIGQL